jgi:hypothetical protein
MTLIENITSIELMMEKTKVKMYETKEAFKTLYFFNFCYENYHEILEKMKKTS